MTNKHTANMMAMLPRWMKMAKDPQSIGAQFLDAFGVEINEIEAYLEKVWNDMYIGTVDLQNADFCYKIPLATRDVIDVENADFHIRLVKDGIRHDCVPVDTLRLFYESDDNVCMIDSEEGFVYIKSSEDFMEQDIFKPFHAIEVGNTLHYDYMLHHIWNVFDEFGMLIGIRRLPGERNEAFKNRILNVFKNPGGANKEGLYNGISRELGISKSDIHIGALTDNEFVNSVLINPDGTPTERYIRYVDQINSNLGFSWDHMNWGEAYWKSIEENNMGIHYLPHIWDGFVGTWKDNEIISGVGDGDDLLVHAPKKESAVREFKAFVGLRGTEEQVEEYHPELQFKYKIVAKGKIPNEEYEMKQYHYTVIASEIIKLHYIVTAMKKFAFKTKINWDTRHGFEFKDKTTPGMDIITGETALHNEEEPYVKLHVDMKTTDRKVTPQLEELIVQWTDTNEVSHNYVITTDADFTAETTMLKTDLVDVEVVNNTLTLAKGSFSAVMDTEGSFSKGKKGQSVKINKNGSLSLDLPAIK